MPSVRLSIGQRLFGAVLLAILAVAACAVLLLRHDVLAGFGTYATGIELDRLEALSTDLARRWQGAGGWTFLPADDRRRWIADELARLQQVREGTMAPAVPAQPAAPAASAAPAAPRAQAAVHPPVPPAPPPLPPLPPPPPPAHPGALAVEPDALPLHERITLLDAAGRYLAGRPLARLPAAVPLARRPIDAAGRTIGYLAVVPAARPSDALAAAFLDGLRGSLWLIMGVAVLLSSIAATLLARHFRRPIRALSAGARQLADGHYDLRLPDTRGDELGELAGHVNALAQRLAGSEQARRQWVADTSHELRTPLAVLRAQLEAVQDGVRSATPDTVDAMLRQVLALSKLVDELYALARADVGALDCRREPLDLWTLACAHARAGEARVNTAQLALEYGPAPAAARVLADPDRMRQVLDNLLENSLRYTAAGGSVRLHAEDDGRVLRLHLDDSGPGVPDEALARLAERFYRVDASRSRAHGGAGLGLALCRRLLQAQGAELRFAHAPGGGLRATIVFPLAPDAA